MTWCDKLASTPSVGLKLSSHFVPSDASLNAISSILDEKSTDFESGFSIDAYDVFNVVVSTDSGLRYQIDSSKVSCAFNHRMRTRAVSAGLPIVEMVTEALPYSEILPVVAKALQNIAFMLPGMKSRQLVRVGVVSSTTADLDEAPPGIRKLVQHMCVPWGDVDAFNMSITGEIGEATEWRDRCTHTIIKSENPKQPTTFQFDWQRTFRDPRAMNEDRLRVALDGAQRDSTNYFENLAQGDMFDANFSD